MRADLYGCRYHLQDKTHKELSVPTINEYLSCKLRVGGGVSVISSPLPLVAVTARSLPRWKWIQSFGNLCMRVISQHLKSVYEHFKSRFLSIPGLRMIPRYNNI